jgi:hypothetical protein
MVTKGTLNGRQLAFCYWTRLPAGLLRIAFEDVSVLGVRTKEVWGSIYHDDGI